MKILFLAPIIDAEHESLQYLRTKGAALLFAEDANEAWKILRLHGSSVDLAVIQQQYVKDSVPRIKSDSIQTDLPLIVIPDGWSDADCAEHQSSNQGANAYLRFPFTGKQIVYLLENILGVSIDQKGSSKHSGLPVLEDGSSLFLNLDLEDEPNDADFHLEPPEVNRDQTSPSLLLSVPAGTALLPISEEQVISEKQVKEKEYTEQPKEGLEISHGSSVSIDSSSDSIALSVEPSSSLESPLSLESSPLPELSIKPDSMTVASEEGVEGGLEGALNAAKAAIGTVSNDILAEANPPASPPSSFPETTLQSTRQMVQQTTELVPDDQQTRQEMPYLFGSVLKGAEDRKSDAFLFSEPIGDAVIPGGVVNSPDLETVKKYLLLREQDVAVLSTQLRATQGQIASLEGQLREERAKVAELTHVTHEQNVKIEGFGEEKHLALESLNAEITEINFQLKAKTDKARVLESQVSHVLEEMEHLKDRVRLDIRKIRVREKELENRLEIMKKDSEALINARETKIIELKRKIDLLEFNMDLLQNQYAKEKETSGKLRERFAKAAQVVRVAGGLLDTPGSGEVELRGDSKFDEEDQKVS